MWIFLRDGFASVRSVDERNVMLRFRRSDHAERFSDELGIKRSEIQKSDDTDYRYRIVASREAAAKLLTKEVMNIGYKNFKSSVLDAEYRELLSGVWSKHWRYQESEGSPGANDK